jgi:hypothetical protein
MFEFHPASRRLADLAAEFSSQNYFIALGPPVSSRPCHAGTMKIESSPVPASPDVEFYESLGGSSPVLELLEELKQSDLGDFAAVLAGLAKLRRPFLEHVAPGGGNPRCHRPCHHCAQGRTRNPDPV